MKKKLLIAIIAIVLAVAIPVTLFVVFGNNKPNQKKDKVNHSAQYIATERAALHDVVDTLLSLDLNPSVPTKFASSANMDITFSENILALLGLEGITFADLGLPNTLTINMETNQDGLAQDITTNLLLNGQTIVTLSTIADPMAGIYYMAIPTISNYYLKASNGTEVDVSSVISGLTELADLIPSLREPLNKYIDLALAQMKNVDMGTETITIDGKSETATVYTNYITEKVAMDIVKAVLTEAKNDTTIKALLPADLNFEATIDLLLSALAEEEPSNSKEDAIVLKLYLNQNGKVIGRSFDAAGDLELYYFASSDNTAAKLGFVADGSGFTLEVNKDGAILNAIEQNVSVKLGSLVFSGDKQNGSIKLSLSKTVINTDADVAVAIKWATSGDKITYTLNLENGSEATDLAHLIISGNMTKGSAELTLSDTIETLVFGASNVNPSIKLDWDENDSSFDGRLVLSMMDSPMLTIKVYDFEEKTPTDIVYPSYALDANDSYDLEAYVNSINISTLYQNLLNAGIPAQLLDAILLSLSN